MSASWSISLKQFSMSASSIQLPFAFASLRTASSASCAERFGLNPKLDGLKSASKIASRTSFAAVITVRSNTVGIESGLNFPGCPGLGISTRRSAFGR